MFGEMNNKMIGIANELMDKSQEYYDEFVKENGKKGVVYITNVETGQMLVYTRGEYTEELKQFIESLETRG